MGSYSIIVMPNATLKGFSKLRIVHLFQAAGMIGLGLIVILSLVPGNYRPHTGAHGGTEHLIAYALTAFSLGCVWSSPGQRIAIIVGLFILAGSLEVMQLWVPGRNAEVMGTAISGLGGAFGVALAAIATIIAHSRLGRSAQTTKPPS